jgi:hypothetical protein
MPTFFNIASVILKWQGNKCEEMRDTAVTCPRLRYGWHIVRYSRTMDDGLRVGKIK